MMIMNAKQIYRVAGHYFSVEGAPVLPNLAPFAVDRAEEPLLFSLQRVTSLPLVQSSLFYKTDDGPGFPEITILRRSEGGYRFQVRPVPEKPVSGVLDSSEDFRMAQLLITDPSSADFALNNALMLLFAFASAGSGLLEMHASVVVQDGKGYLFLGRSGTGKSTHSRLWMENIPGTRLLNDDNPILRLMPDGSARVYGSPWSGKTPCYKAEDAPVGAVVRIRQAPFNKIERLPLIQAYASLMASASGFRPISNLADGHHHTLEGLAATVPCYVLDCLPDAAAAQLCYQTVHG